MHVLLLWRVPSTVVHITDWLYYAYKLCIIRNDKKNENREDYCEFVYRLKKSSVVGEKQCLNPRSLYHIRVLIRVTLTSISHDSLLDLWL